MKHLDLTRIDLTNKNSRLPIYGISENNIFKIQDLILSSGFNYIKFKNIFSGRKLLTAFFGCLEIYYNSIGLLSEIPDFINLPVRDLVKEVNFNDILLNKEGAIENFLFNSLNTDCLIIEETRQLRSKQWFNLFKINLIEFNFSQKISILVFVYE